VVFGEISLSGAVRPVTQHGVRLKEAAKLGFEAAYAPPASKTSQGAKMKIKPIEDLASLIAALGVSDSY
jgi:DNA repair protein RadA/Sms